MLGHGSNNIAFAYGARSPSRREPGGAVKFIRTKFAKAMGNIGGGRCHLHALSVEFMPTWQAHHSAFSIYIFFKTNDTFHLSSGVFAPP